MKFSNCVVIVEGKSDTRRLREIYPQINTFETSGLGIDDDKIKQLKLFKKNNLELICFTDPDGPGEIIRKIVNEKIDGVKNAYVSQKNSKSKNGKVGIESATKDEIHKALSDLKEMSNMNYIYDISFLIVNGIYGNKDKREKFCDELGIANGNNKKVLKQLNNFQMDKDHIEYVIKKIGEK